MPQLRLTLTPTFRHDGLLGRAEERPGRVTARRSAAELLVWTGVGYELVAAALSFPPFGVFALAPVTWLPAAVPLAFRRSRRSFRIAAAAAGAWLVCLSAAFLIVGGLLFLPGAAALIGAAWVHPNRTWPTRRYWTVAATPVVALAVVVAAGLAIDRFGPPTTFEVRLVPNASETQKDQLVDRFLGDEVVIGIGGQGPFDPADPIWVHPKYPVRSAEGQALARRLRAHPLVRSVRPCRC